MYRVFYTNEINGRYNSMYLYGCGFYYEYNIIHVKCFIPNLSDGQQ